MAKPQASSGPTGTPALSTTPTTIVAAISTATGIMFPTTAMDTERPCTSTRYWGSQVI